MGDDREWFASSFAQAVRQANGLSSEFVVTCGGDLGITTADHEDELHDEWLVKTLTSATEQRNRTFLVGHYPLFREHLDESEDEFNLPRAKRDWLLDLLVQHGVVAMLTGHAHSFIAHEHRGVQLVTCETTSFNSDGRPPGFRLWNVSETGTPTHQFVALEGETSVAGEAK